MKIVFLLSCVFLLGSFSSAQNFVVNPGFEEHGEISGNGPGSDNLRGNRVKGWSSPTGGSPDYFLRGSVDLYNQYGLPSSHSGDAMAGIAVYGGLKEYREYISGELSFHLLSGVTYDFSFALALGSFSGEMINSFGICLTNDRIPFKNSTSPIKLIPQLIIDSTDQDNINGKWKVFKVTFTAVGGEKYITIGNFSSDKKTKSRKVNPGEGAPYAYYYIDDVSLTPHSEDVVTEELIVPEISADTFEIAAGKILVIDNVYFEIDRSIIKEESFQVLDEIIAAMKDQPQLNVEIDGHTDSDGAKDHNQKLSEARARSVQAYFISKGIDASRITTKGYGSSRPIGEDKDKDKNRRVEFIFSD